MALDPIHIRFSAEAFRQRAGGVSRASTELCRELQRRGLDAKVSIALSANEHLASLPAGRGVILPACLERVRGYHRLCSWSARVVERTAWSRHPPDVVHLTYYRDRGRWPPRAVPTVLTVYDMIHERFPHFFDRADPTPTRKADNVRQADAVIVISAATKADLLQELTAEPEKVHVMPLATRIRECAPQPPQMPFPFVLFVGRRHLYKNFDHALEAFAKWRGRASRRFVLFGGGPLAPTEAQSVRAFGLENEVHQVEGTDSVLAGLYETADALLYPSLWEGFGLPLLEAMTLGCPIVTSPVSSMAEVCDDAAEYANPDSVEGITAALDRVCGDAARRSKLVSLGRRRALDFSWARTADAALGAYRFAMERHHAARHR